jgi:hypothetical protein
MQMVFGLYVNLSAYSYKQEGRPCSVTYENLAASFFMYFTYFLLFVKFFYDAYVGKHAKFAAAKLASPVDGKSTTALIAEPASNGVHANGHANGYEKGAEVRGSRARRIKAD